MTTPDEHEQGDSAAAEASEPAQSSDTDQASASPADTQPSYASPGYPPTGYPPPGYPPPGFAPPGSAAPGEPQQAYPVYPPQQPYPQQPGYPQPGYAHSGWVYPAYPGYPPAPYPPSGYQQPGYGYAPAPGYAPPGQPPGGYAAPGQPSAGIAPPGFAPPGYAPPAHQQTEYRPGYPAGANPWSSPGSPDPNTPAYLQSSGKRMSTGTKVALWVVPIVVVVCAALGIVYVAGRGSSDSPLATAPTTGAPDAGPLAIPTATATKAPTTTSTGLDAFSLPSSVLDEAKTTDATAVAMAVPWQALMDSQAAAIKHEASTSVTYRNVTHPNQQSVIVATPAKISDANAYANGIYTALGATVTLGVKTAYPTGAMKGSMWCAAGTEKTGAVSVCVVADSGGAMLVAAYGLPVASVAAELTGLRLAIETP